MGREIFLKGNIFTVRYHSIWVSFFLLLIGLFFHKAEISSMCKCLTFDNLTLCVGTIDVRKYLRLIVFLRHVRDVVIIAQLMNQFTTELSELQPAKLQ